MRAWAGQFGFRNHPVSCLMKSTAYRVVSKEGRPYKVSSRHLQVTPRPQPVPPRRSFPEKRLAPPAPGAPCPGIVWKSA